MRAVVLVAIVGCYSPTPQVGLPCASNGACPDGQICDARTDRCVLPGTQTDAAIDALVTDGRPDASIDAAPNLTGCADGQREAFTNLAKFPAIAGCMAAWPDTPSMRAPATGPACGDDLGACVVPASACAPNWHLCGTSGAIAELAAIDVDDCHAAAPAGRFIAAMSHCANNVSLCEYAANLPCFDEGWCSESVCCGASCSVGPGCPDGVWAQATWTFADNSTGCGAQPSAQDLGVLCCAN